jgi:PAS domain S-box-containing protein
MLYVITAVFFLCAGVVVSFIYFKANEAKRRGVAEFFSESLKFLSFSKIIESPIMGVDSFVEVIIKKLVSYNYARSIRLLKLEDDFLSDFFTQSRVDDESVIEAFRNLLTYKDDVEFVVNSDNPIASLVCKVKTDKADNANYICKVFPVNLKLMKSVYFLVMYVDKKKAGPIFSEIFSLVQNELVVVISLKEAYLKLREKYEMVDNVFYKGPLAMCITKADGTIIDYNSKFDFFFHKKFDSILQIFDESIFSSFINGEPIEKEFEFEQHFFKFRGYPFFRNDGSVKGAVFIVVDETIQYLLYKKLEISEKRYRKLIKKLPIGLAILNREGTIYFVNDNFLFSLGFIEFNEIQGRKIQDFFSIEDDALYQIILEIENKDSLVFKFNSKLEFGDKVFSVNLRKIYLGDEDLVEAVFQDISLESQLYSQLDEKNNLIQEELNTARVVQEHILAIPTIYTAGVRFKTFYKPSYKLGGDFFDIIPIDEVHLGVIIADVSGHGVSAALITSTLKILIEFAPKDPHKLHEIISYLNTGLLKIIPEDHFITLFYGIINTSQYKMQYINCGHPFPMIYDEATEVVTLLKGVGFPLGSFKHLPFEDYIEYVSIPENCKLLFYTDGLLGFMKNDRVFNFKDLQKIYEDCASMRSSEILDNIYIRVLKNSTKFSEDDVSMLLLMINKNLGYKKFLSIPSNVMEIDFAIVKIIDQIGLKLRLGEEDRWKLYTAIYEAMINAVEHGNKFNVQKRVTVIYRITGDWVVIKIRDEGFGFKPKNIPDPLSDENILKPSGRGVFMIRKLMDKIKFNHRGNEITMFLQIKGE